MINAALASYYARQRARYLAMDRPEHLMQHEARLIRVANRRRSRSR
jgi:hypothetical protein